MDSPPDQSIETRERHWQERWRTAEIGKAVAEEGRPKFYIIFAYPGPSGFLHLGHMRGYSYADSIARYHRTLGKAVFFPGGTHASGLPAITFAAKVARRDPDTVEELTARGLTDPEVRRLETPENAARYLGEDYWTLWERFGMLMDRGANLTTIDPDYQRFITWQFLRLQRLGRLVQKPYYSPYCPRSGPVSVDPSETDLSSGGNAEMITYKLVPFRLDDGRILLAATLRPETVYGATNVWLPESGPLREWKWNGGTYLATPAGVAKLLEQTGGEAGGDVAPSALAEQRVLAPLTGDALPLILSPIVDPSIGTGVVMSVPAHAPADWVALSTLPPDTRAKILPKVKEILALSPSAFGGADAQLLAGPGFPAERVARNLGAHTLSDKDALAEATARLYRLELKGGTMSFGPHAGEGVAEARDRIATEMFPPGALELREFSERVVCRCGEEVVIRRVPDQWFLSYGSQDWKRLVLDNAREMSLCPEEYRTELPGILDWYEDRPAVRKGKWLGTPFPLDPSWVIEPIADSTFYPAYYIVRRFVSNGRLRVEDLVPEFFDYVFLGEGSGGTTVDRATLEQVRREFRYWYPLDLNLGGKEHKRVHFPVFLYNHAALLPPELQPRGIFINWWLTSYAGGKISKKDQKGGALPTPDEALASWGADSLRLFFTLGASPSQDIKWDLDQCRTARERLNDILRMTSEMGAVPSPGATPSPLTAPIDRWFSTRLAGLIERVRSSMEHYDLRTAAQEIYVTLPATYRRYRARGGSNPGLLRKAAEAWVRLLAFITPHTAEEVHRALSPDASLAATLPLPTAEEFEQDPGSLLLEELVSRVEDDVAALLKVWNGTPSRITLFVAAPWKHRAEALVRASLVQGRVDLKLLMQRAREEPELKAHLGDLPKYAAGAGRGEGPETSVPPSGELEQKVLEGATGFFSDRFHVSEVRVYAEETADPSVDPQNRRGRARPGRPALVLE